MVLLSIFLTIFSAGKNKKNQFKGFLLKVALFLPSLNMINFIALKFEANELIILNTECVKKSQTKLCLSCWLSKLKLRWDRYTFT